MPSSDVNAAVTTGWRWQHLLRAPHRLAFFSGAVMLTATALWWGCQLLAQALGWAWQPAVPVSVMHALLMSLCYIPLFFAGFLYTAGPKWLKLPAVSAQRLLPALAVMMAGWALAWAAMHWHLQVAALGMGLVTLGWATLSLRFARMVQDSQVSDKTHTWLASTACLIGVGVMGWLTLSLTFGEIALLRTGIQIGIWWFLAPVFVAMSHRMVPIFSASLIEPLDVRWPNWVLAVMLGALLFEGVVSVLDLWWWPQPPALRWLQAGVEGTLACLLLSLAVRWPFIQTLKIRLLAMLHGGFVWLGMALALNAASHGLMAFSGGTTTLGLAPLHAMTMGYLGCTMFAMVTRISCGHGGRTESADNLAWSLYWVLQVAVVLRVGAALVEAVAQIATLGAIAVWCGVMLGWTLRYGYWFGAPRPDGRDG